MYLYVSVDTIVNLKNIKFLFRKEWTFSQSEKIKSIIRSFSIGEKVVFYGLITISTLSALTLLWQVNQNFLVKIPAHGGELIEGVVGSPRFINPLLATGATDKDLSALIYSGLLKEDAENHLIPDLAKSYTISEDGLTYTFIMNDTAKFHDGKKVTVDDVIFTINRVQDHGLKSPREGAWGGVKVEKINDTTLTLTLKQPYAPFIYNTTLGILPKHLWKDVNNDSFPFSTLNIKPIGSGPYRVSKVITDSSGLPTEYDIKANTHYIFGEPYITHIIFKYYQNENDALSAYNKNEIQSIHSISPQNMSSIKNTKGTTYSAVQGRVFAIFFNQNQNSVLLNKEVRTALELSIDKQLIIDKVLYGYAHAIDGPTQDDIDKRPTISADERLINARALLEKAGWIMGTDGVYVKQDKKTKKITQTLSLSLSTSDAPELKAEAQMIQEMWTKLGVKVDVKIFETSDLNQNIIRPRKYDALLFGEIIPASVDLYPFWHSSQRNDPGLNIALYANVKTDKLLEDLRETSDPNKRSQLKKDFEMQLKADTPAIFLYAPSFIYRYPQNINNIQLGTITEADDRFNNIHEWYIETTQVWEIFTQKIYN